MPCFASLVSDDILNIFYHILFHFNSSMCTHNTILFRQAPSSCPVYINSNISFMIIRFNRWNVFAMLQKMEISTSVKKTYFETISLNLYKMNIQKQWWRSHHISNKLKSQKQVKSWKSFVNKLIENFLSMHKWEEINKH